MKNENTFFYRYREIILGVFMIALASFYFYSASFIRTRSSVSVSAKMIPQLLGIMVIVLGICQLAAGVRYLAAARQKSAEEGNAAVFVGKEEKRNAIPVVQTFIIILLYAVLFERLGFIIASILCMFSQMWVLTPKAKFRAGKFFAISVIVAVVVYIAFKKGLDLSLPGGVLEELGI